MSIYVMSDLHGCYGYYEKMLKKIGFSDADTLFILGDVIDREPEGIRILQGLMEWMNVGGSPTISEIAKLSVEEREDILDYLTEFSIWETVEVNGKEFVMVHAGLSNFDPGRQLSDYQLHEVLFKPPCYERVYFEDKYLVTGHLPTRAVWAGAVTADAWDACGWTI